MKYLSHLMRCTGFRLGSAVFLGVALLTGCGGSEGPERFDVAGEVTFDGQPVPAGDVTFEPDPTQGNEGPQGFALIRDGRYDTASESGRGVIGGPHTVRVTGWEEVPAPPDPDNYGAPPTVPALFPEYTTTANLEADAPTYDIKVPASAAKGR